MMEVTARFIGKPSMGYVPMHRYRLQVSNNGARLGKGAGPHDLVTPLAVWVDGEGWSSHHGARRCPYTLRGFLLNWELEKAEAGEPWWQ